MQNLDFDMIVDLEKYMQTAIEEAKSSLQEGNRGFGSAIVRNNKIICQVHDTEKTEYDANAHAEMNAIRIASHRLGKNLNGCILLSTHEPCPICGAAIIRSNIRHIAFGYSIAEALCQGRNRIDVSCEELFYKAKADIRVDEGVLSSECSILYNHEVRAEIKKLRNASDEQLRYYNQQSTEKRIQWYRSKPPNRELVSENKLLGGYRLLLDRLHITEEEAPIVHKDERKVVFQPTNFCPTLEACKILDLDTRKVCSLYNEGSTDALIKQMDLKLKFARNYEKLRPYCHYCEEMIEYEE